MAVPLAERVLVFLLTNVGDLHGQFFEPRRGDNHLKHMRSIGGIYSSS